MSYLQLRAFQAVYDHGGFSRAAQELGLSQPVISEHVRKLEADFGVQLFLRMGRRVAPTELGVRLADICRRMLAAERDARALLHTASTLESGTLSMVADAPELALQLLARFREQYPGVRITLSLANAQVCVERVLGHAVDAAVTAVVSLDGRLRAQALRKETIAALIPAGHALAQRTRITYEEFARYPLVFREPKSATQQLLTEEMLRLGVQAQPVMIVEGREAMHHAVAHGIGLGVVVPAEFNHARRLRTVPFAHAKAVMHESLVALVDRQPSHMLDALFACAAQLRAGDASTSEGLLSASALQMPLPQASAHVGS